MKSGADVQETAAAERAPTPTQTPDAGVRTARVVAVIVTWNRKDMVSGVLKALVPQMRACGELHVVVVDNASTDGTTEELCARFGAERVVQNDTQNALKPAFQEEGPAGTTNTPGFDSLTIVRNAHNLGGCGGFNTGFMYVEHAFGKAGENGAPDFVWLLDDDIDLPGEALSRLIDAATEDESVGLVGSRTVDLVDRKTTIESTIFFDPSTGLMGPEPTPGHEYADAHAKWRNSAKDASGRPVYAGVREVDIVSACSLLARWSDVGEVGYWDDRFFIYCDDADWCLRFRQTGKRVVCALDAIVYHTPWTHKLTPERGYYLNRNLAWMIRRNVGETHLRRTLLRWAARLMVQAKSGILNRRLYEADLVMRAVEDSLSGKGGKLDRDAPQWEDTIGALERLGVLRAEVHLSCPTHHAVMAAELFRGHVVNALIEQGRAKDIPVWRTIAPEHALRPAHGGESPVNGSARANPRTYVPTRWAKIRSKFGSLGKSPHVVVVFDHQSEYPLLRTPWTLHVSSDDVSRVRVERDGLWLKARYMARWFMLGVRVLSSTMRARPARGTD